MSFKKKFNLIVFIEIEWLLLLSILSRILDRICITKDIYKTTQQHIVCTK